MSDRPELPREVAAHLQAVSENCCGDPFGYAESTSAN